MAARIRPVSISVRICSKFQEYRTTPGLNPDFEIVGEGIHEPLAAHRILVASACTWFRDELAKPENQDSSTKLPQIRIPENPDHLFRDFLDILYTGKVTVEDCNILGLLKIASFYGAPKYRDIFRHFLHVSLDRVQAHVPAVYRTLVDFSHKLVKWGLEDDGVLLAPILAAGPPISLRPSSEKAALFGALSPRIFAALLNHGPYPSWSAEDKLTIIEQFLYEEQQGKAVLRYELSSTAKASLANLIDWGKPDETFRLFGKFHCGWVPDEIAAPRLCLLLEKREVVLKKILRVTADIPAISPWYVASGLCACGTGTVSTHFTVPIFSFLSTFGMGGKGVNPLDWRLLAVSSVRPSAVVKEAPIFPPENLFTPDKYYLAYRKDPKSCPAVSFRWAAGIALNVRGVIVDTNPRQPADIKRLQQLPGTAGAKRVKPSAEKIVLKFDRAEVIVPIDGDGRTPEPKDSSGGLLPPDDFGNRFYDMKTEAKTTTLAVLFSHGEIKAHRVARLSRVELQGEFLPQCPPQ
jgi:hypothetical protein